MKREFIDKYSVSDAIVFSHEVIDTVASYKDKYPLHYAIRKNNNELVKLLLESSEIKHYLSEKDHNNKLAFEYTRTDKMKK